jgi:small-conductance mechanosensitive channel
MPTTSPSRQPVPLSSADVSLKEYVEKLIDERDKRLLSVIDERDRQYADARRANETAVQAALVAQEKATSTALAAQEKATAAAFSSSEKAIDKADAAYESRFESVNEFRAQLGDQQRTFMPRAEVELLMTSINGRMIAIEKALTESTAQKSGAISLWAIIVGVLGAAGIILTIAARFIP